MDASKTLDEDDMDVEPDQFLADLPASSRSGASTSTSAVQSTPSALSSAEPPQQQERRAQVGASPYVAPFTPSGSPPPRPKTPSTSGGRSRTSKPQLVPVGKASSAFGARATLPRDDVVTHLPPKLLETLVDVVRTLDQLTDGVADFRPDQLGFLSDKASNYVELLKAADKAAAEYHADIPLQVLRQLDEQKGSNPELFTRTQLEKCQSESEQTKAKVETLEQLKEMLQTGLDELQ